MIARNGEMNLEPEAPERRREHTILSDGEFRDVEMSDEWRDELLDPASWHEVLATFAVTTRLAVAMTDPEGRLLGECHNPQPAWSLAHSGTRPEALGGCPFCLTASSVSCGAVGEALRTDSVAMVEDQAGLAHVAVPLSLGSQKLGALIAGQVFSHYSEPLQLRRVARDFGVSRQQLWQQAIRQVPVTSSTLHMHGNLLKSLGQAFLGQRYAAILQRKLNQTAERYRLFIDGAVEYGLYTVDLDGRVTSWSRGAERLFGYTEAEIIRRDSSCLLPPGGVHREKLEKAKADADRSGCVECEGWRVCKDGRQFLSAGVLSVMGEGEDREYGRLVRDVTESRRSQQDLQQAQKMESIGVLASGIAHDFNNLLTGIMGSLSCVKTGMAPDDPSYPIVEIAEQSSVRAAELVTQLLAYAGKGKFVITRFDWSALVADMLPLISASIPKTVKLDLRLAPGLPWIEADASQIRQIVMNLIINGAEAIGAEGGTVGVLTGISDGNVFMEVKDSGSGMSEATQARIFDPFYTTKFLGRGLGLAAVSGIVRGHKGTMRVESSLGQGTTFTVSFPAVQPEVLRLVDPPPVAIPHSAGVILIVDDEPALRKIASLILQKAGYSVLVARDGKEAVEVFRQNVSNIAAVLLDMSMPVMGGREALGLIREMRPGIPIVISSGYGEVFSREEVGPDVVLGFIHKPYSAAKLAESIQEALRHSAGRQQAAS